MRPIHLIPALVMAGAVSLGFVLSAHRAANAETSIEEFQPIKEAELPKGFPGYTAVGRIEVKQYPAYRKATTSGMGEFWTLFQHIKKNDVAMTAPVELEYGDARAPMKEERSMSFLYERPNQGSTGKQGRVEVTDMPAMTVVSIGCRGSRTDAAVADAQQRLIRWLDENAATYEVAGRIRLMGYNSPFIPRDKQFFEVQIPIARKPS